MKGKSMFWPWPQRSAQPHRGAISLALERSLAAQGEAVLALLRRGRGGKGSGQGRVLAPMNWPRLPDWLKKLVSASRGGRSSSYHDLLEALGQEGCPICRLGQRVSDRFLDGLLYECVNDPGLRAEIRASRGFCHRHAWEMAKIHGGGLGIAIICRDVLDTVMKEMKRGASAAEGLLPQRPCPACALQEDMEGIYLSELLRHLDDPQLGQAFAASAGLCLPHLRRALKLTKEATKRCALLDAQRAIWERLHGELDEFIRKNDYRFADEGFGTEGDSWQRALAAISGNRIESKANQPILVTRRQTGGAVE